MDPKIPLEQPESPQDRENWTDLAGECREFCRSLLPAGKLRQRYDATPDPTTPEWRVAWVTMLAAIASDCLARALDSKNNAKDKWAAMEQFKRMDEEIRKWNQLSILDKKGKKPDGGNFAWAEKATGGAEPDSTP